VPYTDEYLDHVFSYHPPATKQTEATYETIRAHAREFFKVLNKLVPDGPDKAAALRHVREAVWTANAGVALDGGPTGAQTVVGFGNAHSQPAPDPDHFAVKRSPYQTTSGYGNLAAVADVALENTASQARVQGDTGKSMDGLVGDYLGQKGLK
jgi:hypothetical protein